MMAVMMMMKRALMTNPFSEKIEGREGASDEGGGQRAMGWSTPRECAFLLCAGIPPPLALPYQC